MLIIIFIYNTFSFFWSAIFFKNKIGSENHQFIEYEQILALFKGYV